MKRWYLIALLIVAASDAALYWRTQSQQADIPAAAIPKPIAVIARTSSIDVAKPAGSGSAGAGAPGTGKAGSTPAEPFAEAMTASRLLAEPDPLQRTQRQENAVVLLRSAVRSRDPRVLFIVGNAELLLAPPDKYSRVMAYAWWLVACERGLDCASGSAYAATICGNDVRCAAAHGPRERLQAAAGRNWSSVRKRAAAMSARLDAGKWSELGIGGP